MTLEQKLTARQIVDRVGMSTRPEFYSGRGAIIDDLTGRHLEKMYDLIEKEYSRAAAQQFTQMVANIPVLTATDFLLTLYRLEANGWVWDQSLLGNEKGVDGGPDYGDGRREAIAMITVASVLGGSYDRNETGAIRNFFLRDHGIAVPRGNEQEERRNGYFDQ